MGIFQSKESGKDGKRKKKGDQGKPKITDRDRAILDLKLARDKIKKSLKTLDAEADQLKAQARTLLKAGRKDRAMMILKMKKMKVDAAQRADQELYQVEKLTMSIESAISTAEILRRIEEGTKVLNQLVKEMPVERVEQLIEDNDDAMAAQQEIDEVLAAYCANPDMAIDESELEDEIAKLYGGEELGIDLVMAAPGPVSSAGGVASAAINNLPQAPAVAPLPKVPTPVPQLEQSVEREGEVLIA